jgi:hypothetical protein
MKPDEDHESNIICTKKQIYFLEEEKNQKISSSLLLKQEYRWENIAK